MAADLEDDNDDLADETDEAKRGERLQKVLAAAGIGSRRHCEELIATGRVEVDRKIVTELGTRVDPTQSEIRVDGTALPKPRLSYFLLNKPDGVVTTNHDPSGRTRAIDLVPSNLRLFPVGRLDRASEGLILLTNDGELANLLAHPRYGVEKTYLVEIAGHAEEETLQKLRDGVHLAEAFVKVVSVKVKRLHKKNTILEIVLNEGRNREIRRILASVGHKVVYLKRIAMGSLRLGDLATGAWRMLRADEVRALRESTKPASKRELRGFRHKNFRGPKRSPAASTTDGEGDFHEALPAKQPYGRPGKSSDRTGKSDRPGKRPGRGSFSKGSSFAPSQPAKPAVYGKPRKSLSEKSFGSVLTPDADNFQPFKSSGASSSGESLSEPAFQPPTGKFRGKPVGGKRPSGKPFSAKPTSGKSFGGKPAGSKRPSGKPTYGKPAYGKPAYGADDGSFDNEDGSFDPPVTERPAYGKPSGGKRPFRAGKPGGKPSGSRPTGGSRAGSYKPTGDQPTGGRFASKPSTGRTSTGRAGAAKPPGGKPTGGKPATGKFGKRPSGKFPGKGPRGAK